MRNQGVRPWEVAFLFVLIMGATVFSAEVNWRVAVPRYPVQDSLVHGFSVKDFHARGDGKTDDTQAFQRALDAMGKAGGGTVFAPEGRWAIKGRLTIPVSVTLRGEWRKPERGAPVVGTVLQVYADRGKADATPFISLNYCSGVRDLSIWHPEQKADDITPYPFAIRQLGGDNATVENVTLVNAYQGIDIGPNFNELHYLHNVYGTPLKLGIRFDVTTDIGRLENIYFSPECWIESGLPGAPKGKADVFRQWLLANGTGIHMLRSDWEYGVHVTVVGYHTGFLISGSPRGFPNAQFYNFNLVRCRRPLYIKGSNRIGLAFTRCRFLGFENAVEAGPEFNAIAQFHDCAFSGKTAAVNRGTGHMAFQHCAFERGGLLARAGTLAVIDCEASKNMAIELNDGVKAAAILSNRMDAPRIVHAEGNPNIKIDHKQLHFKQLPAFRDVEHVAIKPARNALYVVTDPKWGARRDKRTDDTAAIQKALDAAGAGGGGIVFLPPGHYRLAGNLTVPTGVELRGIHEVPHHTMGEGSMLHVTGGKGSPTGRATIALKPKSLLRGLTFHYPEQTYRSPAAYPYLVQGQGADVSIVDITATNVYQYVDLFTHRCDRHYLDYVSGAPLMMGIRVGGGARDGTVRNTQFNPHYWARTREPGKPTGAGWKIFWTYQKENLDAFVFGHCEREVQFQNFVYGSLYGIHLLRENGKGPSGIILGHGTDGSKVSALIDGLGEKGMDFINAELVCMASTQKRYIHLGKNLKSHVSFFNTLLWGDPDDAAIIEAGTLTLQQANFLRHKRGFQMDGGRLNLVNSFFWQGGPVVDRLKPVARIVSMGNVFPEGFDGPDGPLEAIDDPAALSREKPVVSIGDVAREFRLVPGLRKISITLSKNPVKRGMNFVVQGGESRNKPVVKAGVPGWQSQAAIAGDRVRYMYFKVAYGEFKHGAAAKARLSIRYFDEGKYSVKAVYDSSDRSVRVTSAHGAWKEAGRFRLADTKTWKTVSFDLDDALFSNRCNGSDIRLEIPGGQAFTVGAVSLEKR